VTLYGLSIYPFEIYEIYVERETDATYWLTRSPRQRHIGRIVRKNSLGARVNVSVDLLVSEYITEQNVKIGRLLERIHGHKQDIKRAEKLLEDYER